jgi:predicted Rdx family selenoprotein
LFAEGGKAVAITVTPGVGGVLQVFLDGEKVYDKKEDGNQTPHLNRVKEIRAALSERLAAVPAAADD